MGHLAFRQTEVVDRELTLRDFGETNLPIYWRHRQTSKDYTLLEP